MRSIYLDYNATTPLDAGVRAAMIPFLEEVWGNPSSIHHVGRAARARLDDFRERAARFLRCNPSELVFTSSGTESNNLAILGAARSLQGKGKHLITTAVEHHSSLSCFETLRDREGFSVSILPVDREGRVNVADLQALLQNDTILVSIMAANNEIGTVQPVAECGRLCREQGVLFHTDAAQWFGKLPVLNILQFEADLVSLCSHKFHGPKGAGLLFSRSPFHPSPLLLGGGQENEYRAGTENLAAIAGLVAALESFSRPPVFNDHKVVELSSFLTASVSQIPGCFIVSPGSGRLPNTVSFVIDGADSFTILAALDIEGICASGGAACSAGSLTPSHVALALGLKDSLSRSLVRFSLGRETLASEIHHVCNCLPEIVRRAVSAGFPVDVK